MTPWITAVWGAFVATAVSLTALLAWRGAAAVSRRYRQAWTDPSALAAPPERALPIRWAATCLAGLALISGGLLLIPLSPFWRPEPVAGPVLAVAALAASATLYRNLQRDWSRAHALLAGALLTLAICGICRTLLGSAIRTEAHLQALVMGFAIPVALWAWLSRVWQQQLDGDRPWTVAGRLIPMTRQLAAINGALGVFASLWLSQGSFGLNRLCSAAVIAVLLSALTLCLRRWWGIGFVFLLIAGFSSIVMLLSPLRPV